MSQPRELAFLQAIVENPGDEAIWLVLADWLEEQDDPKRAELLRLHRRLLATCCEPDEHPERGNWQTGMVELLAEDVGPCVAQKTILLGKRSKIPITFSWIPPGRFLMGSPENEEERSEDETRHRVELSRGFWLGVHQVTQAQWRWTMGSNPSHFKGEDRPVEGVSWNDCRTFCQNLEEKTGQRFRLPTEAEWEYSCRAGTSTPFHFGGTLSTDQANYNGNSPYGSGNKGVNRQETTPVGSFPPNAWGLYDMHGNVFEWCEDWFGSYSKEDVKDPEGGNSGDTRVLRGGSWSNHAVWCRSADRRRSTPFYRHVFYGCRVVCLD